MSFWDTSSTRDSYIILYTDSPIREWMPLAQNMSSVSSEWTLVTWKMAEMRDVVIFFLFPIQTPCLFETNYAKRKHMKWGQGPLCIEGMVRLLQHWEPDHIARLTYTQSQTHASYSLDSNKRNLSSSLDLNHHIYNDYSRYTMAVWTVGRFQTGSQSSCLRLCFGFYKAWSQICLCFWPSPM